MTALSWSIAIPFLGPVLTWAIQGFETSRLGRQIERLVLLLVVLAFLFYVVPSIYAALGPWSLVILAAAFGTAVGAGRAAGSRGALGRELIVFAAGGGFLVHALADGAALFSFGGSDSVSLAPAIVVDRFTMGAIIWSLVQPRYGWLAGLAALAMIAAATLGGFWMMDYVSRAAGNPVIIAGVQSVLAGIVLYLTVNHRHQSRRVSTPEAVSLGS